MSLRWGCFTIAPC